MELQPKYHRPGRLCLIVVCGLFLATKCVLAGELNSAASASGKRIYEFGLLPSGEPLIGVTAGGIQLKGQYAACIRCHRRSGFGLNEGEVMAPPIVAPVLFAPRTSRRADLHRPIYLAVRSSTVLARLRTPVHRPPYTPDSLDRAIREGVDPAARTLDQAMPRYDLAAKDMQSLTAYLSQLGSGSTSGIDDRTIHFATPVSINIPPSERKAMLDVMDAFVSRHNREVRREWARPEFSPYHKSLYRSARRLWKMHLWELDGNRDTWTEQIRHHYRTQPVFAVLGGLVHGSWTPVDNFCTAAKIPCLFPNTNLPAPARYNGYSLYYSRGLHLEADVLAVWLKQQYTEHELWGEVLQIYRSRSEGNIARKRLHDALLLSPGVKLKSMELSPDDDIRSATIREFSKVVPPTAIILWLDEADIEDVIQSLSEVPSNVAIYASSSYLGEQSLARLAPDITGIRLVHPFSLSNSSVPRSYRLRAWLRSRKIQSSHERLQLNTYFALSVTQHALVNMVDHYSRDYLIESIEHVTERALNPGTYPLLSLGPDQRFASRGGYIVTVTDDGLLENLSGWIVP